MLLPVLLHSNANSIRAAQLCRLCVFCVQWFLSLFFVCVVCMIVHWFRGALPHQQQMPHIFSPRQKSVRRRRRRTHRHTHTQITRNCFGHNGVCALQNTKTNLSNTYYHLRHLLRIYGGISITGNLFIYRNPILTCVARNHENTKHRAPFSMLSPLFRRSVWTHTTLFARGLHTILYITYRHVMLQGCVPHAVGSVVAAAAAGIMRNCAHCCWPNTIS